jgi:hypothetical protein
MSTFSQSAKGLHHGVLGAAEQSGAGYDTVVQYIEMITLPETVKVDTSAIIRDYLKFALMESNQDQNDVYEKDSVIEANKKNIKIIYHTIEEKDTFIKYIEKPDEPANTNLFKRNKK